MATRPKLKVEERKVLGKAVKKLRREGILPANIYGKDMKSVAVQVAYKDFNPVYKEAGQTSLVDVQLDNQTIPSLIHNLAKDYLGNVLHADFFKVNLKEKVKAHIRLEFTGEPKAVSEKIGLLMTPVSEVEIEALPDALPEKIEVPVENLAEVGQSITIADLKVPQGVEILNEKEQVVANISELISKEAEELAQEEAAEAEAAKEEAGEEAAAEGEEKKEEGKTSQQEENKEEAPSSSE